MFERPSVESDAIWNGNVMIGHLAVAVFLDRRKSTNRRTLFE